MTSRVAWVVMGLVLVVALAVGGRGDGNGTEAERVASISREVRCPTCAGLSVAESDAKAAQAVRDEIRERVHRGESDGEIRAYLAGRYGRDILLKPKASGVDALVWALPAAAAVCGVAGLAFAFARWRRRSGVVPTPEDRALVEQARS